MYTVIPIRYNFLPALRQSTVMNKNDNSFLFRNFMKWLKLSTCFLDPIYSLDVLVLYLKEHHHSSVTNWTIFFYSKVNMYIFLLFQFCPSQFRKYIFCGHMLERHWLILQCQPFLWNIGNISTTVQYKNPKEAWSGKN